MESPYAPRRRRAGEEPAPKSQFQRELDAKMRDRRSRGLATDVTESEDELGSDDELMAHFNMTNKPQASPRGGDQKSPWAPPGTKKPETPKQRSAYDDIGHHSNRQSPHKDNSAHYGSNRQSPFDTSVRHSPANRGTSPTELIFGKKNQGADRDMLKTMRQPGGWKPPSLNTRTSPVAQPRRGQYGSDDEASDNGSDEIESVLQQRNRPMPAMRHHRDPRLDEEDKENRNRAKSPGVRGRKTPTYRDSLEDMEERPQPTPHRRSSSSAGQDADHSRRSGTPKNDKDGRKTPTDRRKSPFDAIDGKPEITPRRRANRISDSESDDERKSPFKPVPRGRAGSLKDARKDSREGDDPKGRKSPYGDKSKSRYGHESHRKSPTDGKRTPSHNLDEDEDLRKHGKSPIDRKLTAAKRKSPRDAKGRKSPYGSHEDDYENKDRSRQRSPWEDDQDAHDRRSKGRRSPWKEEKDVDDWRTKGRKSPWEEEVDQRKDKRDERDGRKSPRKSPIGEHAKGKYSSGQRRPWAKDDRPGYRERKRRDDDDNDDDDNWRRDRKPKREESDDRSVHWGSRDRPPSLRRSPAVDPDDWRHDDPDHRRHGSREGDRYQRHHDDDDDRYRRGRYDDREDKYNDRYDHQHGDRYQHHADDRDDGRYPRHRNDREDSRHQRHHDNSDDEQYERRHEDDKRRPKHRKDRSQVNGEESSVCEDVDIDPTMKPPQTREGKEIEKRQPRHQRKEKQLLDDAIDTIKDAQQRGVSAEEQKMRYIDPAKGSVEKAISFKSLTSVSAPTLPASVQSPGSLDTPRLPAPQPIQSRPLCQCQLAQIRFTVHRAGNRPQSSHTARLKPKPRYAKPKATLTSQTNFDSTLNIRDSVYQQWYAERMESARQEKHEKLKKAQEEEEKKKKAQEEKYHGAKASYNSWLETKKMRINEEKRKKAQLEAAKKKEVEEKKQEKLKVAEMTFRRWKEDKDIVLKENARAKKKAEEALLKEKQDKEIEKRKDAEKVFKGWKSTKDEILTEKAREKLEEEQRKLEKERKLKRRREREAFSKYNEWLEKKENQTENRQCFEDDEAWKPAWRPNTSTVPFGR